MTKLTAVIITLNEERNIDRCIKGLQGVADEIVVVDSLSTDNTKSIAESLGAKVIDQPFLGHIEQKNFAKNQASYEWVLSLDADEALTPQLAESITNAVSDPNYDGYKMNRLTNYCGQWIRYSGWYPDTKLRLFKKQAGEWGGTNPHDRFELYDGKKAGHLNGDLLHYSFYTREEHYAQIENFTTIAAHAKWKQGHRSNLIKLLIKPMAKFIKSFIIKQGFRDGYYGWVIAITSAEATFMRYSKLLKIQKLKK
ncbi:MAG: glycosyltransferase family 2 protein [Salibacteraceae bacterium]